MTKILTRKANIRLSGYDYTRSNHYYVTACTENKREWFGEIKNNEMILNSYGKICLEHLQNLPVYYKNIKIDTFVIMPNHFHAIIIMQNNQINHSGQALGLSLHISQNKSLSKINGDYKSFSSREINKITDNGHKFKWQRSFYDHIIRNEKSLRKIREYITNNPVAWAEDEENIKCITIKSSRPEPSCFALR